MTFIVECEVEFSEAQMKMREAMHARKKNTTTNVTVEGLRLSVEIVSLMNRYGYKLGDSDLLEVAKLCSKVAK